MPENSMSRQKQPRPTSDIMLETGRKLLTEVEKSTVADSNKHVSMLLARSRSLDILSSSHDKLSKAYQNLNNNKNADERDREQHNIYVASSRFATSAASSNYAESPKNNDKAMKDETSSIFPPPDKKQLTLLKEKSELNNNTNTNINSNENYQINGNRSSCSSSSSTTSSYASSSSKTNHHKLQRRSSSTTEGGAAFQEVVLKTEPIRITGYLEKRSKVLGWKKFWFVLDGRLLTYYKSKADYESLSACCGCINLGIASTVRPIQIRGCKGYPLQIVTRSQVYYLRSQEKPVLEQWLIAIQEASSSPPSTSILTSWNSYSGSQYFKQPFSSQSQWSLNNSSDDISNINDRLGNLPDTFYQKRDRNSLTLTNPSSHVSPVIHKYHSFASLQTPIVNDFGDRKKHLISSSENLRDLQDLSGQSVRNPNLRMQHSTSLVVLDSSPQAAELRKELTRKLSIGSTKNGSSVEEDDGTVPTAKFLLLSAKKKIQLGPIGDNESHDYAEIEEFMEGRGNKSSKPYENCDVEKTELGNNAIHHQSVDDRNRIRGDSAEKESNIYEHIETIDPTANNGSAVVWEPLNEGNNAIANNKRFPTHRMSAGSNRNSLVSISELPEDVSSISPSPIKTPVLTSIPETSWRSGVEPYKSYHNNYSEDDLSSCRSESFRSLPCVEKSGKKRRGKAFSGFLSKMFGKNKGKGSKSESLENVNRPMIISGPVDLRNRQMQEYGSETVPEKRPVHTGTNADNSVNKNVTENVQQEQKSGVRASQMMPGSRMTINNTIVMDELKQKVGHITLKRTHSKDSSSGRESESPPKENIQNEPVQQNSIKAKAEPRVPYVPRPAETQATKQTPVLVFQTESKSFESNTDDDDAVVQYESQKETQVASICLSPEIGSPTPEIIERKEELQVPVNEQTEIIQSKPLNETTDVDVDFQNKLAKFNRLSQRLSASFIAAAMNPSLHANCHIARSQSYKAQKSRGKPTAEVIPPLPPKKKNAGSAVSIYDVPLNNKPVGRSESLKLTSKNSQPHHEENSIAAYIRGITKKNSTPDIVISGNNAKLFGLRDEDPKELRKSFNSSSTDSFEIHKSSPSLPPPRPPKPKPPTKPKSLELGLNRSKRNSESSSASSETVTEVQSTTASSIVPPPPPMQTLQPPPEVSPTTSNKSLDIDALDALSDIGLSDTKASNSPPDSPKICPLHPEISSRDDLSLSTIAIARTPDSLMNMSDEMVPDSLIGTPDTEIYQSSTNTTPVLDDHLHADDTGTSGPMSINKLEILIHDNDGSPDLGIKSPDTESRMDSLERRAGNAFAIASNNAKHNPPELYQNIKFATVSTLIQEFETVQENEEEISELYDDFPAEFYTPTPSSFSGYSPSGVSTTSTESSSISPATPSIPMTSVNKKHVGIDAIRNSGMEQLEAFLSFGSTSSSDDCSFESCTDNFPDESIPKAPALPSTIAPVNNNNNNGARKGPHQFHSQGLPPSTGLNRTGAISRLGHSSAIGHLQKILTSDVK